MSRSIFPKVFTDYVGIKSWDLNEKDKEEVLSVVSRDKESESVNAGNKIANSLLNIVDTAILGALFYFYQNYNESHDTAEFLKDSLDSFVNPSSNSTSVSIKDETDIDEYTRDALIVCGISLLTMRAVSIAMGSYVFAANNVANFVKDKIVKMSPEDLANALQQIEDEDLSSFDVPKGSSFYSEKMQISYAIAGLVTNFSGFPEDKQYLLFAASRVVVGNY